MPATLCPSEQAPALELNTIDGNKINITQEVTKHDFTLVVFYRGVFCPLCKMHVQDIEENYQKLTDANAKVIAISMDTEDNAKQFTSDVATAMELEPAAAAAASPLKTTIAYGMTEKQAREWGLYISKGRDGTAEPATFSEPGLFVLKPDNSIYMAMTHSAPFSRPGMDQLIFGLQYVRENDYPTRGTLTKEIVA